MGILRQEHWSGLPFPPPEDLPNPAIGTTSPVSPALQADCSPTEPSGKPWTVSKCVCDCFLSHPRQYSCDLVKASTAILSLLKGGNQNSMWVAWCPRSPWDNSWTISLVLGSWNDFLFILRTEVLGLRLSCEIFNTLFIFDSATSLSLGLGFL